MDGGRRMKLFNSDKNIVGGRGERGRRGIVSQNVVGGRGERGVLSHRT